ncbi:MAG: ComF family protein [Tissierellia bacterium]|nr:ComF family protein [Tissierellia bacterium]
MNELLDLLYGDENFCGLCETRELETKYICKKCLKKTKYLGKINFDSKYIDALYARTVYEGDIRYAILKLKYQKATYLSKTFAKLLEDFIYRENLIDRFDSVVYIPMREKAKAKRGYNQMQLVSKNLAKNLNKEFIDCGFSKTKDTKDQIKLSAAERIKNVKNAFSADFEIFNSKNILLIDDTITTGATVENFSKALKNAGTNYIIVLGIAATL